jgi:phosphoribosylformylglycinamidine synthase PurS subunit
VTGARRSGDAPDRGPGARVICAGPYELRTLVSDPDVVTIEVRVELKPGVFDAEADNVQRALAPLGVEGVAEVATARLFSLTFRGVPPGEARRRAQLAVDRLLANPVIHRVEILGGAR